jgi:hypothetical protein
MRDRLDVRRAGYAFVVMGSLAGEERRVRPREVHRLYVLLDST